MQTNNCFFRLHTSKEVCAAAALDPGEEGRLYSGHCECFLRNALIVEIESSAWKVQRRWQATDAPEHQAQVQQAEGTSMHARRCRHAVGARTSANGGFLSSTRHTSREDIKTGSSDAEAAAPTVPGYLLGRHALAVARKGPRLQDRGRRCVHSVSGPKTNKTTTQRSSGGGFPSVQRGGSAEGWTISVLLSLNICKSSPGSQARARAGTCGGAAVRACSCRQGKASSGDGGGMQAAAGGGRQASACRRAHGGVASDRANRSTGGTGLWCHLTGIT